MASTLPKRLLTYDEGHLSVIDPRAHGVDNFDIISYTWGQKVPRYDPGINGVSWAVRITPERLEDIKRLMRTADVRYLWVDCVCINQDDDTEKDIEIPKMYEYYKNAHKCHILVHMEEVWDPRGIVDNLRFIDHMLSYMDGARIAGEARLTPNLASILNTWENTTWAFLIDRETVMSAAIETGVLNCYATSVSHVKSLFDNLYFSRVWTFQEMLLGKNIAMWGMNSETMSEIGELDTWMDLATACRDKAYKLQAWIESSRVVRPNATNTILGVITEDQLTLGILQTQVRGISSARTDILTGGRWWWRDNYKGVSNIFSAVSITPRECDPEEKEDVFKGLLGVFSGLFTAEEIGEKMKKGSSLDKLSFAFFRQLSLRTGYAWTKLSISSGERAAWDWIPVVPDSGRRLTTDCFAGVVNLGRVEQDGLARAQAVTGLVGSPRPYMKIRLSPGDGRFQFVFKGCNRGKNLKTGTFSSEPIPADDRCRNVVNDETGRALVECATILGSIMDPGNDVIEYRRRLLSKLNPDWHWTDPSVKPTGWIDRCVSGTPWGNLDPESIKAHNCSMNYNFVDIFNCRSRLYNNSTNRIMCEIRVNCGCTITGPFSLIFEAVTAVCGSFLGSTSAELDADNRIVLRDGLGLVQVGDVGKTFDLVAFRGDVYSHRAYASICRHTKKGRPAPFGNCQWPTGRAFVREDFGHGIADVGRDYGYVETGGSGNLLMYRNHPLGKYKIIGVCIDEAISSRKGEREVTIR